jgi:hypothetical protein
MSKFVGPTNRDGGRHEVLSCLGLCKGVSIYNVYQTPVSPLYASFSVIVVMPKVISSKGKFT